MDLNRYPKELQNQYKIVYRNGGRPTCKCVVCDKKYPYKPQGQFRLTCSPKCRVKLHRLKRKEEQENEKNSS